MHGFNAITVFAFVCSHCRQPNEYRASHRAGVKPHLITTKCTSCGRANWLGGVEGRLEEDEYDGACLSGSESGSSTASA